MDGVSSAASVNLEIRTWDIWESIGVGDVDIVVVRKGYSVEGVIRHDIVGMAGAPTREIDTPDIGTM